MAGSEIAQATWLDLFDYRERVAAMYRERDTALHADVDPKAVLEQFRAVKNALFAAHPQSALDPDERVGFAGLRYFPYNPALRLEATLTPVAAEAITNAPSSGPHPMPLRHAARLDFAVDGTPVQLTVFWIDVYGGGLFLPFRDATCPAESYGAGRYLFDTVKGSTFERADGTDGRQDGMGYVGGRVILDFNYAYNPSCCYNVRWACPLAPRENWLSIPIRAGELNYHE